MSGRSNKLAGQIAEYLVCAELGRRDLIATPFSGNVPTFDVLATDEHCRTLPIQVKATRGDDWRSDARLWMNLEFDPQSGIQHYHGPKDITNSELIYVCVAIASPENRDRFFILTKADLQQVCMKRYHTWMEPRGWKRDRSPECYENRYSIKDIQQYEDNWDLIIHRLKASAPDISLTSVAREEADTPE